jgi:hypothetical protein
MMEEAVSPLRLAAAAVVARGRLLLPLAPQKHPLSSSSDRRLATASGESAGLAQLPGLAGATTGPAESTISARAARMRRPGAGGWKEEEEEGRGVIPRLLFLLLVHPALLLFGSRPQCRPRAMAIGSTCAITIGGARGVS